MSRNGAEVRELPGLQRHGQLAGLARREHGGFLAADLEVVSELALVDHGEDHDAVLGGLRGQDELELARGDLDGRCGRARGSRKRGDGDGKGGQDDCDPGAKTCGRQRRIHDPPQSRETPTPR